MSLDEKGVWPPEGECPGQAAAAGEQLPPLLCRLPCAFGGELFCNSLSLAHVSVFNSSCCFPLTGVSRLCVMVC